MEGGAGTPWTCAARNVSDPFVVAGRCIVERALCIVMTTECACTVSWTIVMEKSMHK